MQDIILELYAHSTTSVEALTNSIQVGTAETPKWCVTPRMLSLLHALPLENGAIQPLTSTTTTHKDFKSRLTSEVKQLLGKEAKRRKALTQILYLTTKGLKH